MPVNRQKPAVLFHCAGSRQLGLGHLYRCRMLFDNLAGNGSLLTAGPDPDAAEFLDSSGLPWRQLEERLTGEGLGLELAEIAGNAGTRFVVLDCRDNSREFVMALHQSGLTVIDLEDNGPGRLGADVLIDPHIQPGSHEAAYPGRADCCFGPGWALIDPVYARLHREINTDGAHRTGNSGPLNVTVSLGGSDASGLTARIVELLAKVETGLAIDVVLGPAATADPLPSAGSHRLTVHRGIPGLAGLLTHCGLAFVSGGITMFESLCLGVPTAVVPQHEEQYLNASRLARRGALIVAPPPGDEEAAVGLEVVVRETCADSTLRNTIGAAGFSLVDGLGMEQLASRLNCLTGQNEDPFHAALPGWKQTGKESRVG
ncbi:MAG: hypothetical protein FVQ81_00725 [Candidatus Glassbacteria bacterium]|nr:hypothetical protein [Candidatus Glassbacteria bacterium]